MLPLAPAPNPNPAPAPAPNPNPNPNPYPKPIILTRSVLGVEQLQMSSCGGAAAGINDGTLGPAL